MVLEETWRGSHEPVSQGSGRMTKTAMIRVGTAGWSIPRASASRFDAAGTHLQRYSRRLGCAEINSSFYRPHAAARYAKWRNSTPPDFRFAVKLPRTITHELGLEDAREPFVAFLHQTEGLAEKRGPVLVQLPPSLEFDEPVVTRFLELVRDLYNGVVVCEPRHATWFSSAVDSLLKKYTVARVAADPAPVPSAADPAGWSGVAYFRLHGSPRKYWSRYDEQFLVTLATTIRDTGSADEVWCVFDNTASGAAMENAWELSERLALMGTS
jgi:uncharacterized protein YecE (DUF72 family)